MDKYNEALERARNLYPGVHEHNKKMLEQIFPELRESEDERIRKALVKYFEERNNYRDEDETFNGIPFPAVIAYLEKQKEQVTDESDKIAAAYQLGRSDERKQKEQKPAWSEEDEKMLSDLRNTLGCLMNAGAITFKTKKKFSNWLKSIRPSWKPTEEQMKALQWWSELPSCSPGLKSLYEDLKKLI